MAIYTLDKLTKDQLQAFVDGLAEGDNKRVYEDLFTTKYTSGLSWESLESDGRVSIAAFGVEHNSDTPVGERGDLITKIGKLPKIGLKLRMTNTDIHNYDALLNSSDPDERAINEIVFGDAASVYHAVKQTIEIAAMSGLSTGIADVNLSKGIRIKANYGIASANKKGAAVAWTSTDTSTPLDDFEAYKSKASYAVMTSYEFGLFTKSKQVREAFAGFVGLSVGNIIPTYTRVNEFLRELSYPQIKLINPLVNVASEDGTVSEVNPWSEGKVTFLKNEKAGQIQYTNTAYEKLGNLVRKEQLVAKQGFVSIKRWINNEDSVEIFTKGEAVAIPVLTNTKGTYLMNVKATSWS